MTAGRHTVVIGQTVQPSECSHTHRQKDSSDSITSTADAGGNESFSLMTHTGVGVNFAKMCCLIVAGNPVL